MRSPLAQRLAHLAFLAPAIAVGLEAVVEMRRPSGAQTRVVVTALLNGLWIVLAWLPRGRALLAELSAVLLRHLGPLIWLLVLGVAVHFASGSLTPLFAGLAVAAGLLVLASWLELRRNDPNRAARRLALLGIWVASFLALDLVIGRFVLPGRSHDKIFTRHDPVLGWRLRPSFSLDRREEHYRSHETSNSLGFRTPERPFAKPDGVRRIVLLGDSHGEAYTVDDDKTMARLLERDIGPGIEVISLGVGGYSTDQELLSYLEVGRRFRPDLVLLQFCSNDVAFNVATHYWRGRKPVFVRYGETLLLSGVPVPDTKTSGLVPDWLANHSSLFAFLEGQLRQLDIRQEAERASDMEEAWRVTELLIRDLRRVAEEDGARLLCFDVNADDRACDARLRAILERHDVPYLDLAPAYAEDFDGLWVSGHWNETGQRRAADALLPSLRAALADRPPN